MSARFRIRTSQGQELSFASHEMFTEFVRSGDLAPDDVVYDSETREWAPARTHPVVLQIELEAELGAEAAEGEEASATEDPSEGAAPEGMSSPGASDIGLDLAPAPEGLTPEQEAAAFVAKMEAERAADRDFGDEPSVESFMLDPASATAPGGRTERVVEPPADKRPPAPLREPAPKREQPSRRKVARGKPKPPQRKKERKKGGGGTGRRYAPFLVLGGVALALGVYFGPGLLAPTAGEGEAGAPDSIALPPPPSALIPDTEEALRARARERFLTSTQALLRNLPPIPDVWLHGAYLAAPSDYPPVREVWEQYLTTIRDVRAGDDDRYRAAYLRALDDARIEGSARTLRLASATASFRADSAARVAHYERVEALAIAALQGHDALVEAEGTISYEPAVGPGVSADPVIEAVGRGAEAQALLDDVLDLILGELHDENGPGEAAHVREWVWDGLLDAVTN